MAQKPKIEYVEGLRFFHGTEAPRIAESHMPWKARLPKMKLERFRKITIDPAAAFCLAVAVLVLILLISGSLRMRQTMIEYNQLQQKLSSLKRENATLSHVYHTSYDLEQIRQEAEKIGMIDGEQTERFTVIFSIPEHEEEPSAWDEFVWLISGLLSNPKRADAS